MAKAKTTRARKTATTSAETPDEKRTQSAKRDAAAKLFDNADAAAMAGLPPEITVEQRENQVRLGALGY